MKRILTFIYVPAAFIYLLLSIVYPMDPHTIAMRGMSTGEARIIAVSAAIPLIALGVFAFYGAWRFRSYAQSIKQYSDGVGLAKLASGLLLLALNIPIRSVTKILLNYLAHLHPSLASASYFFISYFNILVLLVSYVLISQGARSLANLAKAKTSVKELYAFVLLVSMFGAVYCHSAFSANMLSPSDWLITTQYNVAVPIRILTVIVPYLFMWTIGLLAARDIYTYQKSVKGVIYRQSFRLLAIGLVLEVCTSIFVQYITTIAGNLATLPTIAILVIVYCAFILLAISIAIIIKGVKKLEKYES